MSPRIDAAQIETLPTKPATELKTVDDILEQMDKLCGQVAKATRDVAVGLESEGKMLLKKLADNEPTLDELAEALQHLFEEQSSASRTERCAHFKQQATSKGLGFV